MRAIYKPHIGSYRPRRKVSPAEILDLNLGSSALLECRDNCVAFERPLPDEQQESNAKQNHDRGGCGNPPAWNPLKYIAVEHRRD